VEALHADSPAPAKLPEKNPFVDVELVINADVEYRVLAVRADDDASTVLSEFVYIDEAVALVVFKLVEYRSVAVRAEDEALVRVVFPVTLRVEEKVPVLPISEP
jgi:hypothetical protein